MADAPITLASLAKQQQQILDEIAKLRALINRQPQLSDATHSDVSKVVVVGLCAGACLVVVGALLAKFFL